MAAAKNATARPGFKIKAFGKRLVSRPVKTKVAGQGKAGGGKTG